MTAPVLLDGGLATELHRAGFSVRAPWWATRALLSPRGRGALRRVHGRFIDAGAQVITANTFRCNLRALRACGLDPARRRWAVHVAVGAARAAALGTGVLVAGSMAPLEDCYRPDLVPADADLRAEHRWLATELERAGVDLVLIETMNTVREARIALEQALAVGCPAWVSFVCSGGARLLSGERLASAARAVERDGAQAVLVNCTPVAHAERCLEALRSACTGVIGLYPNLEARAGPPPEGGCWPPALTPAEFAEAAHGWHTGYGAAVLGGCCGASPEHIAALGPVLPARAP